MDRRVKLSLFAVGLLLGSLLLAYVSFQAAVDPIAQFRAADGSLKIPAGAMTPELQKLLFPAPAPKDYTVYHAAQSAYPTLEVRGYTYDLPAPVAKSSLKPVGTDSFKAFWSALTRLPKSIVSFFESISPFGNVAAADRFLVLGGAGCVTTTIATDIDCWSATSGGAGGASVPVAADNFLADGSSGAGTGTLDAAMSFTNLNTTGFTGIIAASTFAFTISGTVTIGINGAIQLGSGSHTVSGTWTNSITDVDWDAGTGTVTFNSATGGTMTFVGANLAEDEFNNVTFTSSAVASQTFTMATRGIRWTALLLIESNTVLDKTTFSLIGGQLQVSTGGTVDGLVSTSGAVTLNSNASSVMTVADGGYIDFGSEAWTVSGAPTTRCWNDAGTPNAAWEKGTGTVTLECSVNSGVRFAGTLLAEDEFNNLTLSSSSATPVVFTMTSLGGAGLRLGGTLTISDGASTTALDTSVSNFAITAGAVTIGAGGILTANASTITVNGLVNISAATGFISLGSSVWTVSGTWTNASTDAAWDAGTGTVIFNAGADTAMTFAGANLSEAEFNHVTFNSTAGGVDYTMATRNLRVAGTITITDTVTTVSLVVGALDLIFDRLTVTTNGTLSMNGIAVTGTDINTNTGSVTLTAWTLFTLSGDTDIRWTFDPSVASASVTVQISGLVVGRAYTLLRDNENAVTADANGSGQVTLTVADGWSSHDMRVIFASSAGGGGNGGGGSIFPALPVTAIGMAFGWLAVGALAVIALMHLFRAARGWGYRFAWIVFVASAVLWFWLIYGMR